MLTVSLLVLDVRVIVSVVNHPVSIGKVEHAYCYPSFFVSLFLIVSDLFIQV